MKFIVTYNCSECGVEFKEVRSKPVKRKRKKKCEDCRAPEALETGAVGKQCVDCIYWRGGKDTTKFFKRCEKGQTNDLTDSMASSDLKGFTYFTDTCHLFREKDETI